MSELYTLNVPHEMQSHMYQGKEMCVLYVCVCWCMHRPLPVCHAVYGFDSFSRCVCVCVCVLFLLEFFFPSFWERNYRGE